MDPQTAQPAPTQNTTPVAPPAPAPTDDYARVPDAWPGAFQLYKYAKSATLTNWQLYLGISVASIVLYALFNALGESGGVIALFAAILNFISSMYIAVATIHTEVHNADHTKTTLSNALQEGTKRFVTMIFGSLLVGAILVVSILALVVPFFFVLPRVILTAYFIVAKGLGASAALDASWKATKGHSGKIWGIIGVMLLFGLLMITIIGIPFALYLLFMYSSAFALFFRWLERSGAVTSAATPVAAANGPIQNTTPPPAPIQ